MLSFQVEADYAGSIPLRMHACGRRERLPNMAVEARPHLFVLAGACDHCATFRQVECTYMGSFMCGWDGSGSASSRPLQVMICASHFAVLSPPGSHSLSPLDSSSSLCGSHGTIYSFGSVSTILCVVQWSQSPYHRRVACHCSSHGLSIPRRARRL
ncbi:hypothetical protein OG21DRAFT_850674 [Imleria badia]|nr:hypothetical protein OG21DRAFT_850674 [Imleria badia]